MGPLSEAADLRIDTSHTQLHELRDLVRERIARRAPNALSLQLTSFQARSATRCRLCL